MTDTFEQVRVHTRCMKSKIADAILQKLDGVLELKYKSFDQIRINMHDFNDAELPAVQIIDIQETGVHQQASLQKTWQLTLEVVMKQTSERIVRQQDLWDLMYLIERKLWQDPSLGIPGVFHLQYIGNNTDLHVLDPYYIGKLDFQVVYQEHLVRDC